MLVDYCIFRSSGVFVRLVFGYRIVLIRLLSFAGDGSHVLLKKKIWGYAQLGCNH